MCCLLMAWLLKWQAMNVLFADGVVIEVAGNELFADGVVIEVAGNECAVC